MCGYLEAKEDGLKASHVAVKNLLTDVLNLFAYFQRAMQAII